MLERGYCGSVVVVMVMLLAAIAPPALAASQDVQPDEAADGQRDDRFLRVASDDEQVVALEIAVRRFAPAAGDGPIVTLVGVSHIGDAAYYRALQDALNGHDLVLYESVKPPGTGGAAGETDEERVENTKAGMRFVAGVARAYHAEHGRFPDDLAELDTYAAELDARLPDFLSVALVDAWGGAIQYDCCPEDGGPADAPPPDDARIGRAQLPQIISFGADGQEGGEGADQDLVITPDGEAFVPIEEDDQLQNQLAKALDLEFQLTAIDYSGDAWRCSDMSVDQLERAMRERGLDFTVLGDSLAGSSFPARVVKFLLGFIRIADRLSDGAISDTIKIVLIEMLGDESLIEASLEQVGDGLTDVIIRQRNQVVIDELQTIVDDPGEIESVALFYGAGHMSDFAERLGSQLGYEPVGEVQWLRAIEVDLATSAVSEAQVRQLRRTMRMMMRQMAPR